MRITHLMDAAGSQATGTTLALLAESLGRLGHTLQKVLLLGGSSLQQEACAAGVSDATVVGVPRGHALLGWPAVTRALRQTGEADIIHCWSPGAFAFASLARRSTHRVLTMTTPPSPETVRWLRVLCTAGGSSGPRGVILTTTATIRHTLISGGVPVEMVHVLRPGLDMGRTSRVDRASLRESWGVESEQTRVVALLSDPPGDADALYATMAVGLAQESYSTSGGVSLLMLVHPDQRQRRRAESIHRHLGRSGLLVVEPRLSQPWEVLPACDAALALRGSGEGLSLLWAMASNVPIVGEATYGISEIVEDRHSALLVKPGVRQALSTRIRQLTDDRQLAWKLRDTARHEAYSYFSRLRYCQSLESVYEQIVASRPVEIPVMQSTGGLRFTGRG